jgi:hypothetical protein
MLEIVTFLQSVNPGLRCDNGASVKCCKEGVIRKVWDFCSTWAPHNSNYENYHLQELKPYTGWLSNIVLSDHTGPVLRVEEQIPVCVWFLVTCCLAYCADLKMGPVRLSRTWVHLFRTALWDIPKDITGMSQFVAFLINMRFVDCKAISAEISLRFGLDSMGD